MDTRSLSALLEPALKSVVLVALTGYGRNEDKSSSAAAGFDYHLVKPVEPQALEAILGQVVGEGGGRDPQE